MSKQDRDKLLQIADRVIDPTIKITERVSITPNLPGSSAEWNDPLKTATDKVSLAFKPDKNTSVKLGRSGKSVNLTLTKKF